MYYNSTENRKRTIAEAVLMIKPVDFCFNAETAVDNEFQNDVQLSQTELTTKVLREFDGLVSNLREAGVDVLVFDKTEYPELKDIITPDAVFPNNWISTDANNLLYTYNMYTSNRKNEKKALPHIEKLILNNGYTFKGIIQVGSNVPELKDEILEGTGSMIIDRQNNTIYACRSLRTCDSAFQNYLELTGYNGIIFDARSRAGTPFYHTNMIMCVGQEFISICLDSIVEDQREAVLAQLKASGKEIIDLTLEQVEKHCLGNVLEVRSKTTGENIITMSERAFKALTPEQKAKFEKYGKIVSSNIDTIEEVGGGSVRCMQCEIYLKKKDDTVTRSSPRTQELVSPANLVQKIETNTNEELVSPAY